MSLVLEKDVESYLKKKVKELGGRCIKFYSASDTGLPDRIVALPGGKVIFIELKRPKGGKLAPIQRFQIDRLMALGCNVAIVKNFDDVDNLLKKEED